MYEQLSDKYEDNVAFGKIDVDENSDASSEYDITAVPTFVFMDKEVRSTFCCWKVFTLFLGYCSQVYWCGWGEIGRSYKGISGSIVNV